MNACVLCSVFVPQRVRGTFFNVTFINIYAATEDKSVNNLLTNELSVVVVVVVRLTTISSMGEIALGVKKLLQSRSCLGNVDVIQHRTAEN